MTQVEVYVEVAHPRPSDLDIELKTPDGTTVVLQHYSYRTRAWDPSFNRENAPRYRGIDRYSDVGPLGSARHRPGPQRRGARAVVAGCGSSELSRLRHLLSLTAGFARSSIEKTVTLPSGAELEHFRVVSSRHLQFT